MVCVELVIMVIDRRYSLQIVGEVLKQLTEDKCKDNYI